MKTTDISRAARAAAVMTASLLALACSDDDYGGGDMLSDSSSAGEGVYIACGIADIASSAITRADATEAGWTDAVWNENGIATLSVYIYSQQEEGSDGYALKYSGTTTSVNDGDKWKLYYSGGSALKPDDISATDSVFLIANYTVAEEEPDIEDLWADTFALGKTRGPQSSIVMSTRGIVDSLKSVSGDSLILGMTLERAIAKIALRIYYKRVGAESYEQLDSCVYDDGDSILFKLCNYAATGAVIDTPDSVSLQSEADYALSDTMYVEDGDARAVFYVCPNCWLDTTKVSSMNTEEPIDTLRQTHLMMMIKDTGHGQKYEYEYEIPVNYLLPEDNDAQEPDASYVDLYNIYRNHVYNVSIYVEEVDNGFMICVGDGDDMLEIEELTETATEGDTDESHMIEDEEEEEEGNDTDESHMIEDEEEEEEGNDTDESHMIEDEEEEEVIDTDDESHMIEDEEEEEEEGIDTDESHMIEDEEEEEEEVIDTDESHMIEDINDEGSTSTDAVSDGIIDTEIEDIDETVEDEDENIIEDRTETN